VAEEIREVQETTTQDGNSVQKTQRVTDTRGDAEHTRTVAERIVWYIAGVLLTFMAFRFILSLLGANRSNAFADFIYSVTYPFVAPFFGLFGYKVEYGVARFEIETLVAMAVYALIAWGIVKLININK
jgi:hypothetical protein